MAGTIMGVHAMSGAAGFALNTSNSICRIARHVLTICGWCTPEQSFMQRATQDSMDMSTETDMSFKLK